MPECRSCGDEHAEYRSRSRMYLCEYCHAEIPEKVTRSEFMAATFAHYAGGFDLGNRADAATAREFYDDYRMSSYADPAEYWSACSACRPATRGIVSLKAVQS
jgi:hypothetical protein